MGQNCCKKYSTESEKVTESNKAPSIHNLLTNNQDQTTIQTPKTTDGKLDFGMKVKRSSFIQITSGDISSSYKILSALGAGSSSTVYKAISKVSGAYRAIKSVNKKEFVNKPQFLKDMKTLSNLDHPNIIKVFEVFEDQTSVNVVSELCTGGDLFERVTQYKYFSENKAALYMFQLLSAVSSCHSVSIFHGDIRPESIVFQNETQNSPLKIIYLSSLQLSSHYTAPEALDGQVTDKSDVWSLGVILYFLLCGKPPFVGQDADSLAESIQKSQFSLTGKEWARVSADGKSLVMRMLTKDPAARLSSLDAFSDSWVQSRSSNREKDNVLDKQALINLSYFRDSQVLQRGIMSYLASSMSFGEEDLRKSFISLDTDGDGRLSLEEVKAGFLQTGLNAIDVEAVFKQCDIDQNGYIEYSEFLAASIDWHKTLSQERLISAFKTFDKDGNGSISRDDLLAFFSELKDDELWNSLIQEADRNGDGEIDLEEFKNLMLSVI